MRRLDLLPSINYTAKSYLYFKVLRHWCNPNLEILDPAVDYFLQQIAEAFNLANQEKMKKHADARRRGIIGINS